MQNSETKREFILAGIWADHAPDGSYTLHFSIPDLLAGFGWPDNPENRAACEDLVRAICVERFGAAPEVTD